MLTVVVFVVVLLVVDDCGVCNGDNSTCLDDCGVPNATIDDGLVQVVLPRGIKLMTQLQLLMMVLVYGCNDINALIMINPNVDILNFLKL